MRILKREQRNATKSIVTKLRWCKNFEVTHLRSDYETGTQYGDTVLTSGKTIMILANEG
jgi:hypothetical protein